MPYRLSDDGKGVQVFKNGKWIIYQRYTGPKAKQQARNLLAALKIKVHK